MQAKHGTVVYSRSKRMADWFIRSGSKSIGPVDAAKLRAMAANGEIDESTEISQSVSGPFVKAANIKGLFQGRPTAATMPVTAQSPSPQAVTTVDVDPLITPVNAVKIKTLKDAFWAQSASFSIDVWRATHKVVFNFVRIVLAAEMLVWFFFVIVTLANLPTPFEIISVIIAVVLMIGVVGTCVLILHGLSFVNGLIELLVGIERNTRT